MDSFISGATMDKAMAFAGVYSQPQSVASLNQVSESLKNWDLITKVNQMEQQNNEASMNFMVKLNFLSTFYIIFGFEITSLIK